MYYCSSFIMKRARALLSFQQQHRNISCTVQQNCISRLKWESRAVNTTIILPVKKASQSFLKNYKFIEHAASVSKMSTQQSAMVVEHDPSAKKFFIRLAEDEAKLEYTRKGDTLNMWHTEVPPPLQGQGIAKVLATGAFDHAVKNNLKMVLTCPYLQKFYKDNPKDEYKKLVVG